MAGSGISGKATNKMNPQDSSRPNDEAFDNLDDEIRKALSEEGVIIPKTIEEVRQAKAQLKAKPVTIPPHLRDPDSVIKDYLMT